MKLIIVQKGGKGSGDFGHAGRPGKVGGSSGHGVPAGEFDAGKYRSGKDDEMIAATRPGKHKRKLTSYMPELDSMASARKLKRKWSADGWKWYEGKSKLGNTYTIRITRGYPAAVEVNLRGGGSMFRKSFPLDEMGDAFDYFDRLIETDLE